LAFWPTRVGPERLGLVVRFSALLLVPAAAVVLACAAQPQTNPVILRGAVRDALNRPVAHARVEALDLRGAVVAHTRTDGHGRYVLSPPEGAVELRASAAGLAPAEAAIAPHPQPLILPLASVQSAVNVTALDIALPEAQVGNTTSTLSRRELRRLDPLQAAAALRLLPGLGVVQSGQTGGVTSVFLRGAPADFTKVLLDGVPIQRIDLGGYDFSNLVPVGLSQIQVVRGPDSVVYGSDAAAGVISLRTRRGRDVEAPVLEGDLQVGTYSTAEQSDQMLGSWGAFDYALRYGYLDTHNQQPDAGFRNNTYGGDFGWKLGANGEVRLVAQRSFSDTGQPNAILFYGLSQGAFKNQGETYASLSWTQQVTPVFWQRLRVTQSASNLFSEIPGPVGIPDGAGDYDGLPVEIVGANGYSATGQAILSFGGAFPQTSPSDTLRRDVDWDANLSLGRRWSLLEGYRFFDERGLSSNVALSRHDNGAYALLEGSLGERWFVNGGVSADRNTPFGFSADPQVSLAFYPRLRDRGWWDETRLRASAGTGLKDPSLEEEEFSLYDELQAAAGGAALIHSLGLAPVIPQRSRGVDAGVDQYLDGGRGEWSATWFDQHYYDLIEDIPPTAFAALGIPAAVAQAAPFGGEYNSLAQRAYGLELETRMQLTPAWRLAAAYTATAAKVLKSFSFDAQAPSFNPALPGIAIGAFAPLTGARPFRVAPQVASLEADFARGPFAGTATAFFMSRRDDSTFLTDAAFGNTLLLPNRNLDPAYGVVNLSGSWRLSRRWQLEAAVDNALNRQYQEVIGYPAPGITARLGLHWTFTPPLPGAR
jgi:vitamin B12 transporter